MSSNESFPGSPHFLIAPYVDYPLSTNEHDTASPLQPDANPWFLSRATCADHMSVPLRREWMSRTDDPNVTSRVLKDLSDLSQTDRSQRRIIARKACISDLISETQHQLSAIDPPVKFCNASTGFHVVSILSQAQKDSVILQRRADEGESGSMEFPPSSLAPDYLRRCAVTPLTEREVVFSLIRDNGQDYCRCSFAGPSLASGRRSRGAEYQAPFTLTQKGESATSNYPRMGHEQGMIGRKENREEMSRLSREV
ncbi:uncharacterized protein I303_103746 [Kwoniella dejecticola CBS 10117]|uniref:Uncharacterized protein n=1 Tax=Kwoniella dejecticola CBS 10117 TaxID=1296121 RepID=A0A1A6A7L1_9TREE|nr:uncharacterized protein I303_03763 [Kwoniella dejecticola CBS 10117]OBR86045.1 hypothetical protein I303_03763 [Kwoniella dejecticola CBS 10117]